ncbi:transposase [Rhodococcus qingshengii]|uniref:transposase n=1 Tax=Rhodococcus qingshengii TaxID=334542 RepID=UPI001456274F|nr:transposase [Rhodococcus qingshengii]
MTEKHRQFSPQFKAEAVQMVVGLGRSLAAVARDLEINPGTLGNWVKAWREENPDPATATNPMWRRHVWRRWSQKSAGCGWKTSF